MSEHNIQRVETRRRTHDELAQQIFGDCEKWQALRDACRARAAGVVHADKASDASAPGGITSHVDVPATKR